MTCSTKRERRGSERSTKSERLSGKSKGNKPILKEQASKDKKQELKLLKKGSKQRKPGEWAWQGGPRGGGVEEQAKGGEDTV